MIRKLVKNIVKKTIPYLLIFPVLAFQTEETL